MTFLFIYLQEQYEAFLKFNHDQLARRFGESAASCKYTVFIQQFVGDGKDADKRISMLSPGFCRTCMLNISGKDAFPFRLHQYMIYVADWTKKFPNMPINPSMI